MARNKEIPTVLTPPSGDGHHRTRREMRPSELAEREARQAAYDAMLARQDDFEKNLKRPSPKTERPIAGCVFAKSCHLPDGMINHESTVGFIPTTSLDDYGNFALLGGRDVSECGRVPLKKISGAPSFITGSFTLARAASISVSATEAAIVRAGSLVTAGVATGGLVGLVVMLAPSSMGDSALYTEEQLRSLNRARTRVRLRVEQQADGTLKGYGYNTQTRRDWEFIPVVTFKLQGSQQVADFGDGVTLIWTPPIEPSGRSGIPPLEGGDVYHGHVRSWDKLHQDIKNALIKAQKVDNKGNISGVEK